MNTFRTKSNLNIGSEKYTFFRLKTLEDEKICDLSQLPFSIRILLENMLRNEDGKNVKKEDILLLAKWSPKEKKIKEIAFSPARVLLQDFTGVPAVLDLAAMRGWISKKGKDPQKINPLEPVDLVIDHSLQVDSFGRKDSAEVNKEKEYSRNKERYQFLKWGQHAFNNFKVVPPGTGIIHQVNLEYLAKLVFKKEKEGEIFIYPDTLVGTDSHTTMINGLGVLGWGVGGIEAEAAMLGQPISMLIPEVIGVNLKGSLQKGVTATDLVLTVTEILRKKGVVGKFVEFFGEGVSELSLAERSVIANMAPEYGATIGFFPADKKTIEYLNLSGREESHIKLIETYLKEQKLFKDDSSPDPCYTDVVEIDLNEVVLSLAGPKRPQDRIALKETSGSFKKIVKTSSEGTNKGIDHGAVVIASITSCTNTSNPAVMLGAGLVAKKAVERGLQVKPWVKTSLAPGSKVVIDYLNESKLLPFLEELKFNLVGFGCATCIGNSGPLSEEIEETIKEKNLIAVSVLSGNRNFEGRINPFVRANYLASPALVVVYALAGTMKIDIEKEPLGIGSDGKDVYFKDIWPTNEEIKAALFSVKAEMFKKEYRNVFEGDKEWREIPFLKGSTFEWDEKSTYIKNPPYFEKMTETQEKMKDIINSRVLVMLGDSVTTDHISPAGAIPTESPAAEYLKKNGVAIKDFNSYGSRRGNHEVMMRGTFGNVRLRNLILPRTEGGVTKYFPEDKKTTIFSASEKYREKNIPLIVIAGKEYGSGSSRDWAAKGPALLGVKAVIAESYERIHRSNLIGMGILPLQFKADESRESLNLDGSELYSIDGISDGLFPGKVVSCKIVKSSEEKKIELICRIDTPIELEYYKHGGILQYVLRQLI